VGGRQLTHLGIPPWRGRRDYNTPGYTSVGRKRCTLHTRVYLGVRRECSTLLFLLPWVRKSVHHCSPCSRGWWEGMSNTVLPAPVSSRKRCSTLCYLLPWVGMINTVLPAPGEGMINTVLPAPVGAVLITVPILLVPALTHGNSPMVPHNRE